MAKREFVQLAHTLDINKTIVAAKYISEKLDGQRFFWDGGVSRGVPVEQVPWANIEKSNLVPLATGLWSRYGKVINAPNSFLDNFPPFPLEGELWTGYNEFQKVSSIVRSNVNVKDWADVKVLVFDSPPPDVILADGVIDNTNYHKVFRGCFDFYIKRGGECPLLSTVQFSSRYKWLKMHLLEVGPIRLHTQEQLPHSTKPAIARIHEFLDQVLEKGGEGVMVKATNDLWLPQRCHSVLKFKPFSDGEGVVVGYTSGRETDKGSKLLGLMGALILKINAGTFKISGFKDSEREMVFVDSGESAKDYLSTIPDQVVPSHIHNPKFPIGSTVTYLYRELTDANIPKEARYLR